MTLLRPWPRRAVLAAALGFVAVLAAGRPAPAIEQSTPAEAAILIDITSGAVLLEKNADEPLPPASMSKLMTLEVVFEAVKSGRLSLSDEFRTSRKASDMGGSKMFIREGELVSVENLIRGVVVHSGNDAAVALAEALSGTEEAFSSFLNSRAEALGLENSHFANSTGWPHPEHRMSVRDLAILAEIIVTRFPDLYPYFQQEDFTWDGITQPNRNPLLDLGLGVDGLKTGHTSEAGYGLVASARRGDRRVVLVVAGLETASQRKQEAERLINWAFRAFETRTLYEAGEPLVEVPVWIGSADRVALAPARDVVVTLPFGVQEEPELLARYVTPAEAPIEEGAELGRLTLKVEGMADVEVPLLASEPVARGGFVSRVKAAAELVIRRVLPDIDLRG